MKNQMKLPLLALLPAAAFAADVSVSPIAARSFSVEAFSSALAEGVSLHTSASVRAFSWALQRMPESP